VVARRARTARTEAMKPFGIQADPVVVEAEAVETRALVLEVRVQRPVMEAEAEAEVLTLLLVSAVQVGKVSLLSFTEMKALV
jgi:phage gp46-like protein